MTAQTSHRVSQQPAYVLHQRPYRDTSALVELFTPMHGRVGVVAKGVKRPKSPWRGLVQQFRPLLASWSGRGDLATLTGLEAQGQSLQLSAPLLASGFYLNELLMRLLQRHEAQVELFSYYDSCLRELAGLVLLDPQAAQEPLTQGLEAILRRFEGQMLETLGYGLILDHDVATGEAIQPAQDYFYQLERGPVAFTQDSNETGVRVSGTTLLAMNQGLYDERQTRREAKHLMRAVLAVYLGPKPLLSRQMLQGDGGSAAEKETSNTMTRGEST
jgi:DNA repair protein RecO (recombination protein O)